MESQPLQSVVNWFQNGTKYQWTSSSILLGKNGPKSASQRCSQAIRVLTNCPRTASEPLHYMSPPFSRPLCMRSLGRGHLFYREKVLRKHKEKKKQTTVEKMDWKSSVVLWCVPTNNQKKIKKIILFRKENKTEDFFSNVSPRKNL